MPEHFVTTGRPKEYDQVNRHYPDSVVMGTPLYPEPPFPRTRDAGKAPMEAGSQKGQKAIFGRALAYGTMDGPWQSPERSAAYFRKIPAGSLGKSVGPGHDVICSYVDPDCPLARGLNGSLKLFDSASALDFEFSDDGTEIFTDVYNLIKNQVLIGMDLKLEKTVYDFSKSGDKEIGTVRSATLKHLIFDPFLTFREGAFMFATEKPANQRTAYHGLEQSRRDFLAAMARTPRG